MIQNKINFVKPKIVISKCLEFAACRYDGQIINNNQIKKLKKFIDFIPICPEVEIGMSTPRDPIRIINNKNKRLLYQPQTGKDFSKKMDGFSKLFLKSLNDVDGFIFKSDSPSCGVCSAKIYSNKMSTAVVKKSSGFFTKHIISNFKNYPIEEEKRLNNIFIRENFYTCIFTIADFKNVNNYDALYKFQAKHKYLFMAYNQTLMTKMGNIAANKNCKCFSEVKKDYFVVLLKLLSASPKISKTINTQMHIMGYFKQKLTIKEKQHFLTALDLFRNKKISSATINFILSSWVNRFGNKYLEGQSFFSPFPEKLIESDKARFFI